MFLFHKEGSIMSKKLNLLLIAGMLALSGCKVQKKQIEEHSDKDALLINVEKTSIATVYTAFLYFDTDKNPETAEAMLSLNCLNDSEFLHIFNEATIGKTLKISQWDKIFPRNQADKSWYFTEGKTKE